MSERWMFPWEEPARRGAALPEELALADQMAYTTLRNIYWSFREKRIDREQASREKRVLRREWEKAKDTEAFERKLVEHHVRLIRAVEQAVTRCRKEPTAENALRLCDAIDGMGRRRTGLPPVHGSAAGAV